ncbi:hypothetical protein [Methylotenera versatilis]|uniref:hypothetical protein n=1 Tax=Methylotenera versatilis TaxID=1055487 RepID=UPI0006475273|nr:hypothetical protein [Methylotenera versatilis]
MSKEFCKQAFLETNLIAASQDLFGEHILEKHIESLLNTELSHYSFANTEPAVYDKWVAVSSLHKSIRRGEVKTAFHATSTLLSLDPAYLIKRLQIIVFEDIGIANPSLCLLTLLASSKRLHNAYGRDKVIHYLVEQMVKSAKSRNATDIYCFTLSDPDAANYLHCCLNTPVERLVTVALDTSLYITHRMTALKVISGFSERHSNGYHRTISKARLDLLGQICDAMSLPDVLNQAVLLGNAKTAGLNAAMLLAFEMLMEATNTQVKDEILHSNEYQGINLASLDIYCRSGRQVISDFVAASKLLQQFFIEYPNKNSTKLVGTVLFIIEGSLLNREFIFTGSQSIKEQIELMEMQGAGLKTKEETIKLIDLINKEMSLLQQIRAAHIDVIRG